MVLRGLQFSYRILAAPLGPGEARDGQRTDTAGLTGTLAGGNRVPASVAVGVHHVLHDEAALNGVFTAAPSGRDEHEKVMCVSRRAVLPADQSLPW